MFYFVLGSLEMEYEEKSSWRFSDEAKSETDIGFLRVWYWYRAFIVFCKCETYSQKLRIFL